MIYGYVLGWALELALVRGGSRWHDTRVADRHARWLRAPLARLIGLAFSSLLCGIGLAGSLGVSAVAMAQADAGAADAVSAALDPAPGPQLWEQHGEVGHFFNPWKPDPKTLWAVLRWWFFSRNPHDKSRPPEVPVVANDGAYLKATATKRSITWVGHATLAIHDGDDVILTDPHFGKRAAMPARVHPPGVPLESIPDHAFAVLSHNHYDHLDAYTVDALPETVEWYVGLGMAEWFRKRGRERVVELDWWQSARRGRWTITCLPAQHWSRRLGQGMNAVLWCSWLIESGDTRYYFSGDTGYFEGFAEFRKRYGPIDVAILSIGAYEPRWFMEYQHMNPEDAYRAFRDLGARFMIPMHWGTFDLTDEPLDLAPRVLDEVVERAGGDPARVRTLAIGERWFLPQ